MNTDDAYDMLTAGIKMRRKGWWKRQWYVLVDDGLKDQNGNPVSALPEGDDWEAFKAGGGRKMSSRGKRAETT